MKVNRKFSTWVAVFGLLLIPLEVFAWGEDGHRVVGEIAWNFLQPAARGKVAKLLQIADEPSLAEAATWADRIRSDSSYNWAAPLHYINLSKEWQDYEALRDCNPQGCILEAIVRFEKVLADSRAPEFERAEALLFLAHFVGDLHQPMHTGLAEDRGGNDVAVTFFGLPTNLHALWDVYLPAGFIHDWREYSGEQAAAISDTERRQWLDSSLTEWAKESHHLAHSHAYPAQANLGEIYYLRNREIVELRLRQGGVRLAGVINAALGESL